MTVAKRPSLKDRNKWLAAGLGSGVLVLLAMFIPLRLLWLLFHAFHWIPSTDIALLYGPPRGAGWLVLSSCAGIAVTIAAVIVLAAASDQLEDKDGEPPGLWHSFWVGFLPVVVLVLVPIALLIAWLCELFWAPNLARHLTVTPWFAIPIVAITTGTAVASHAADS